MEPYGDAGSKRNVLCLAYFCRHPAVSAQSSPLISVTTQLSIHVSKVGKTRQTPFPERVGARAKI